MLVVHYCERKCEILLVPPMLWEIFRDFEAILGGIITTKDLQTEDSHNTLSEFLRTKKNILGKYEYHSSKCYVCLIQIPHQADSFA